MEVDPPTAVRVARACTLALIAALLALAADARAATPDAVDAAIKRGTDWLYSRQKNDLQWEEVPYDRRVPDKDREGKVIGPLLPQGIGGGQWGGLTSLSTYALLSSGQSPTDPRIERAVDFLRRADVVGTYALGLRAQVWLYLPKKEENRQAMARDARLLMEAMQGNDPALRGQPPRKNVGLFDYLPGETERVDLSVSQYGVLGLWAAVQYGWELPPGYWQAAETAWYNWQQPDGGWAYGGTPDLNAPPNFQIFPTTLSMTAAGVASLYITLYALHANEGVRCNGNVNSPRIDAGLRFLAGGLPYLLDKKPIPDDRVIRQSVEGNIGGSRYYTLYGVERIGVASGLKFLGDLDWYAEGADWLLRRQNPNGSWGGDSVQDTSFALLFLSRGREPVFMNKLIYDEYAGPAPRRRPGQDEAKDADRLREVGHWNQRPRDVANLTRFVNEATERTLNWQSVKLQAGREGLLELAESPILYLAGDGEPALTDAEKQTLRDFVYSGGLILGNADCGKDPFERGFVKLGQDLFPDYEFRVLEDDSPIYTEGQFPMADKRRKPKLMALGNGAREFMVLVRNEDFARDWQLGNLQNDAAFQVGTNLYLYATDKVPQPEKGRTTLVFPDDARPSKTIRVARVKYNGNWDPEPGGWQRLAAVMHNRDDAKLDYRPVDLASEDLSGYEVAHLTGTGEVQLPPAQAAKLKAFVEGGGTLVVDAAGGSGAFLRSIEGLLRAQFPGKADSLADVLPTSHPIYSAGREPIKSVAYRLFALKTLGSETAPPPPRHPRPKRQTRRGPQQRGPQRRPQRLPRRRRPRLHPPGRDPADGVDPALRDEGKVVPWQPTRPSRTTSPNPASSRRPTD